MAESLSAAINAIKSILGSYVSWRCTANKVLLRMGITWEEAEVAAVNKSEWHRSGAQCIHLDVG